MNQMSNTCKGWDRGTNAEKMEEKTIQKRKRNSGEKMAKRNLEWKADIIPFDYRRQLRPPGIEPGTSADIVIRTHVPFSSIPFFNLHQLLHSITLPP